MMRHRCCVGIILEKHQQRRRGLKLKPRIGTIDPGRMLQQEQSSFLGKRKTPTGRGKGPTTTLEHSGAEQGGSEMASSSEKVLSVRRNSGFLRRQLRMLLAAPPRPPLLLFWFAVLLLTATALPAAPTTKLASRRVGVPFSRSLEQGQQRHRRRRRLQQWQQQQREGEGTSGVGEVGGDDDGGIVVEAENISDAIGSESTSDNNGTASSGGSDNADDADDGGEETRRQHSCSLFSFAPFTSNGTGTYLVGLVQAAAAILAAEHFNARNPVIVQEIAPNGDLMANCPYRFDLNRSLVFDTGTVTHLASRLLADSGRIPCAVAGPFNDVPALDLSTMAQAYRYPLVASRAFNSRVTWNYVSPYSSQVYPSVTETAEYLVGFLKYRGRTNYTAMLYDETDASLQRRDALSASLRAENMAFQDVRYVTPGQPHAPSSPAEAGEGGTDSASGTDDVLSAMARIKEWGYRTIVVSMNDERDDLPLIADAAAELNLTNGEYFWVFFSQLNGIATWEPKLWPRSEGGAPTQQQTLASTARNVMRLLEGSAAVVPIEQYRYDKTDPFLRELEQIARKIGQTLWDRIAEQHRGRSRGTEGPEVAPGVYAEEEEVGSNAGVGDEVVEEFLELDIIDAIPGTGFMYDAVMSIGIGMCLAHRGNLSSSSSSLSGFKLSGQAHLQGIRRAKFNGVSGYVSFAGEELMPDYPGVREPGTVAWGGLNWHARKVSNESDAGDNSRLDVTRRHLWSLTDIHMPGGSRSTSGAGWAPLMSFYYADGRKVPPSLLRDPPEMNNISEGLQIFGFTLYGITVVFAAATAVWVFACRKHSVLVASQPPFLYTIVFGSFMFASAIIPVSFDESLGFTETQLSMACMAIPWLACMGHVVTYGALFSKLWRVDRVLQFTLPRRVVMARHVLAPSAILVASAGLVLGLWTGLDPLKWQRKVINDTTGESVAQCRSDHDKVFSITVVILMLMSTVLACYMAWKTKDVDSRYAESSWIFLLVFIQSQICLVTIPLVIVLAENVSSSGRYTSVVILFYIVPTLTLGFIMVPKIIAYYKDIRGITGRRKRGERAKISGSAVISRLGSQSGGPSSGIPNYQHNNNNLPERQQQHLCEVCGNPSGAIIGGDAARRREERPMARNTTSTILTTSIGSGTAAVPAAQLATGMRDCDESAEDEDYEEQRDPSPVAPALSNRKGSGTQPPSSKGHVDEGASDGDPLGEVGQERGTAIVNESCVR